MKSLQYGVPYEYIPFATDDHSMAGDYDDLVNQVYLGNFDAVAGDVTIIATRSQHVDFTLPYLEFGITMVAPYTPDNRKNGWIFLKPLTWQLWVTSLASTLIMGVLVWTLEHPKNKEFRGPRWQQFGTLFWFAFSTMVFVQKEKVVSNSAKIVLIVWFLVVLILTQSYTANLASMLTVQRLHPTITDVETLIKHKMYVGYKNGSFVYDFLVEQLNFEEAKLVAFNSPEEMDKLFRQGSGNGGIAAAFHEVPYIKLFLSKYCSEYTMVDPIYRADGFGFVFPLVPDVSRAILRTTEGKTMTEIERNLLSYKDKCRDSSTLYSGEDSLPLASFRGLFMIIGLVGLGVLIYRGVILLLQNFDMIQRTEQEQTDSQKLQQILELVKGMNTASQGNPLANVDSQDASSSADIAK